MKLGDINIDSTINAVKEQFEKENNLSPAFRSALEFLLVLVALLIDRITLNSKQLGGQFSHCYMPFTVNHFGGDASPAIAL